MSETDFLSRHCIEYPKGSPVLAPEKVRQYLPLVPGWELAEDGKALRMVRRNDDFVAAVALLNRITDLAEAEQHHPDVRIFSYRMLELVFTTHSVGGLTDNDFIMAARVSALLSTLH